MKAVAVLSKMFGDAMMNQFSGGDSGVITNTPENPNLRVAEGGGDGDTIPIKDSSGLKSGKYSKATIQGIIKGAKATGVDPFQALALSLQETGLGTAMVHGRRGKFAVPIGQTHDFSDQQQQELDALNQKTGIDPEYLKLGIALRDKLRYAKQLGFNDEASQLQAYNGYGTLTKEKLGGADKAYGVPVGNGIDMRKNPLYGKRLVQLKNDLMANKDISSLITQ
jgi:hypothetical protein